MKTFIASLFFLPFLVLTSFYINVKEDTPSKKPVIKDLKFGSITINDVVYDHDIVIENGEVKKRKKSASKDLREKYGHTPLTEKENIPWNCDTLVIGIGMSSQLPVTDDFKAEAKKKNVTLILLETPKATEYFMKHFSKRINAIFHITC